MPVKIEKNPLRRSVHVRYNGEADTYSLRPGVLCYGQHHAVYGTDYQGALTALTDDYDATYTCAQGILSRASVAEPDEYLYAFQVGSDAFTSSAEAIAQRARSKAAAESGEAVDPAVGGGKSYSVVLVDVVERESGFPDVVRVAHHYERPRHSDNGDRAPRVIVPEVLVAEYERQRRNAVELGSMIRQWAHKIPGEGV